MTLRSWKSARTRWRTARSRKGSTSARSADGVEGAAEPTPAFVEIWKAGPETQGFAGFFKFLGKPLAAPPADDAPAEAAPAERVAPTSTNPNSSSSSSFDSASIATPRANLIPPTNYEKLVQD